MSIIRPDITVVIGSMRIGGAERATLNLINGLSKSGLKVELVLLYKVGNFLDLIDSNINIINLNRRKASQGIGAFRKYLKENDPNKLLVIQNHIQLMVLIAVKLSSWKGRIILNEQSTYSKNLTGVKGNLQRMLSRILFSRADIITAVSEGAANDLKREIPKLGSKICVIPNAVITDHLLQVKDKSIEHPFFHQGYQIIISAGRFISSKNFDLLIKAFLVYNKDKKAKLILLGDGEEMHHLKRLSATLDLKEEISFPGFVADPCIYFSKADLFVLSSDYEGLPGVLIEALACGCKVVSTDCESGPAEILENGKFGLLTPVGEVDAMVRNIEKALNSTVDGKSLMARANDFHVDKVVLEYLKLFKSLS